MAYAKSEETRQRLVKVTSKLLRTQGYAATGVSQILKESGVPKGSLYHHFPSGKTELAAAAVDYSNQYIVDRLKTMIADTGDAVAPFELYCDYFIYSLERSNFQFGCPIATITLEAAATVDAIQVECSNGFGSFVAEFVGWLMENGVSAETSHNLATLTVSAVEGALILCRAQRSTQPLITIRNTMSKQLRQAISEVNP